jgi:RNA recognition motif-containing protein
MGAEVLDTVIIRNLPSRVHRDEIEDLLKECGEIISVKILEGKGFGFV